MAHAMATLGVRKAGREAHGESGRISSTRHLGREQGGGVESGRRSGKPLVKRMANLTPPHRLFPWGAQ